MYDIKNLKIWKDTEKENPLLSKKHLIEIDAFIMEAIMRSDYSRIKRIFEERLIGVNRVKGKSMRFNIYMSEKLNNTDIEALELSVRSYNCLKRAGIMTIGDLCTKIHSSSELKMIRNCGSTSVTEIMDKLFYYHFMQIPEKRLEQYIEEVVKLNS